jgi:hypothetical protein
MNLLKPVQADQIRALLSVVTLVNEIHDARPYYVYGEDPIENDFAISYHFFQDYISTNRKRKRAVRQKDQDDFQDTKQAHKEILSFQSPQDKIHNEWDQIIKQEGERESPEERRNRLVQEKRNCQAMAQFMSPEEVDFYRTHKRVKRSAYQRIQELQITTCVWTIDALIGSAESCYDLFCGVFGRERLLMEEKRYKESSDLFTHEQVPLEIESRRQYTLLVRQFTHLLVRILRSITRVRDVLINKLKYCVSLLSKEESESNNFSNLYFARRVPPYGAFHHLAQEMQYDIVRSIPYVVIVSSSARNGLCSVMIEDPRLKRFEASQENDFSTGPCLASEDESIYFRMNTALFAMYNIEKGYSEQKEPREIMKSSLRLTDSDIEELFPGKEEQTNYLIEPVDIDQEISAYQSPDPCPVPYHDVVHDLFNHVNKQWKVLFKKLTSPSACWYLDITVEKSHLRDRYFSDMFNFAMTTRMPLAEVIADCYYYFKKRSITENEPEPKLITTMITQGKHIRFPNINTRTTESDPKLFLQGSQDLAKANLIVLIEMAIVYATRFTANMDHLRLIHDRLHVEKWPRKTAFGRVVRDFMKLPQAKELIGIKVWDRYFKESKYQQDTDIDTQGKPQSVMGRIKLAILNDILSLVTPQSAHTDDETRFEMINLTQQIREFIEESVDLYMSIALPQK